MLTKHSTGNLSRGRIAGKETVFFESTTSTNDRAFEIGQGPGGPDSILVIAGSQTNGRGRMGRTWFSPPGANLYFSLLQCLPDTGTAEIPPFTLAAAVEVTKAIREATGLKAWIKWPNDILVNNKKAGGILLEMKPRRSGGRLLVTGIGVNVNMDPGLLPEGIRTYATSLKAEKGRPVDRRGLLEKILHGLDDAYKNLLNGNKRDLINEWLRLNSTIGNKVKVRSRNIVVSGIAEGISDTGELVLILPSGGKTTFSAGDVSVIRE